MKLTTLTALGLASGAAAGLLDDSTEELKLDMDDVPMSCKTICQPVATLSKQCDVDLGLGNGKDEDLLHNQCVCTNNSFKVGQVAAECADCMHQHVKAKRSLGDHNDDDDIDSDDVKGTFLQFLVDTHRHTGTQTHRHTDIQTHRHTHLCTHTHTLTYTHIHSHAPQWTLLANTLNRH